MIRLLVGAGAFVLFMAGCSRSPELAMAPEHGTAFLVRFDSAKGGTNGVEDLKSVFRKRFDRFGTKIFIESISANEMRVSTPEIVSNKVAVLTDLLGVGGAFEIRLVHEESDQLVANGLAAPGYEKLVERRATPATPSRSRLVKMAPEISGPHIEHTTLQRDPMSQRPTILVRFDQEGAKALHDVTARSVGKSLALVVDGKVLSAPRIAEPIAGGSAAISGGFTMDEAFVVATVLEMPLTFPVTVVVEKTF